MMNEVREVRLSKLTSFPESPFKTRDGSELELLKESIRENGVIDPLIVRPENGGYQIISGQRRADVCRELGMETVPVIVKELDRDAAVILFVDSNISRDQLLPSEKAFAYRMKLEAVKHQRAQLGYRGKSIEYLARFSPESRTQIQRFIRLTELEKPLLDLVDGGRIALTPAVEISYLSKPEQRVLIEAIESEQGTPTLSQAVRLRDLSREGRLDEETVYEIMREEKGNQKEVLRVPADRIRRYFRKDATPREMEETIIRALDNWYRRRNRDKER